MVLVTGGTGFLGAYILIELVEKGHRVRAIRREGKAAPFFIPEAINKKIEWVTGDVLDTFDLQEAMKDVDTVIHSAGKVSFDSGDREALFQVNVEGTANVVNVAIESEVRKFIHISSVASLGRTANGETVTEEKDWEESSMNTTYAQSKHKGEMEVWRGAAEGLDTVILNPSTIIGYGNWNESSCRLFKTVYDEFPYYTNGINGFVYVKDVAEIATTLCTSQISGERFLVTGENWSFRDLFNSIADEFKKKRPHFNATPLLAQLAWRAEKIKSLFNGKRALLTKESARIAQSTTYFDNSKILKALPSLAFTPLTEAVSISCRQYLANLQQ